MKIIFKVFNRQGDIPVTVHQLEDGNLHIIFDDPVKAITPGQAAVLYLDDVCLGSSIIKSMEPLDKKYAYFNKIK